MDTIAAKYFNEQIDTSINDTLGHLYTYLHTLESLLNIKKKFSPVDALFYEYIDQITNLHYMLKTGKLRHKPSNMNSQSDSESGSDSDIMSIEPGHNLPASNTLPTLNTTKQTDTINSGKIPASVADAMDEADLQLDSHINARRKEYERSIAEVPVQKTTIKWLTETEADVCPRTLPVYRDNAKDTTNDTAKDTDNAKDSTKDTDNAIDKANSDTTKDTAKDINNSDEFEVIEEQEATPADIIAALEARKVTVAASIAEQSAKVEPKKEEKPKSLSAITAEALGVHFCTPDDEPATVNALFKIGPRHRDMLYTKLYLKAKDNINLLKPDPAKFDELVRLETDRLLSEWIAAH